MPAALPTHVSCKKTATCSVQEGLWIFNHQRGVPSLNCLDPWVMATQGMQVSSQAPYSRCCPRYAQTLQHCGTQDPFRGVVQHTPCPHSPRDDNCIASPGNTWNTCRPHKLPHYRLTERPQWPSLPVLQLLSLLPHFWSCLTLAGAEVQPCPSLPGKARPLLERARVLGLDWNFSLWGHSCSLGEDFSFPESAF